NHALHVHGGSLPLASTIHDKAIVTGNGTTAATGTALSLHDALPICTPGANDVNVIATDPNRTLTSGSPATLDNTTFAQGPLDAGDYSITRLYSSDCHYTSDDSPFEKITISKASAVATTEIHNGNHHA